MKNKDPKQTKKLPKRRLADHFFGFFKKKTDLTISSWIGPKNIDAKVEYLYFHNTNNGVIEYEEGEYFKVQKDKFEAAVIGHDGAMYCMPLREKRSVKIVPGKK